MSHKFVLNNGNNKNDDNKNDDDNKNNDNNSNPSWAQSDVRVWSLSDVINWFDHIADGKFTGRFTEP